MIFDIVESLKSAQTIVESSPNWRKFIDGTPLENDIAVMMAEFARSAVQQAIDELPADWNEDASLETWFPLTAQTLKELREAHGGAVLAQHAAVERAELAEGMFAEMQKFESVRNGDILSAADKLRHELKLTRYAMIEGGEEEKYCTTLERINSILTETLWIDHGMPIKKGGPTAASSSPATGEGEVPNAAPADHATTPPGNRAGWGPVAAQVNHLLNLEAAYKGVCEKREKIPFKWGSQPDRDALQERANELSGEIMRTERRIIEGLKASASERAAGVALKPLPAEEKYNAEMCHKPGGQTP